ncbi:BZ3500_MvSof-1268-A1-R1_Chr1-3g01696 [Microbotryum saponariae]|uniref:BZ3500_MvSof-1268-A1-R1_Chr1-3g01696 protein n=1 Tax=Microbotryum saponariae TaxID=289078 RepID=A0A2X0MR13_9BASI|nr:BZ3500_MvSof-1268-A1-R1_Chr1-3g01696 [Microbotryum saponariae]SCZ94345.1 BZ3501_MvSof-1269-A2-R1_Chr1-3g01297 [Microbotryum saponariae]
MSHPSDLPCDDDSDRLGFDFFTSAALQCGSSPRQDDMRYQVPAHQAQQYLQANVYAGASGSWGAQIESSYDANNLIDQSYASYPASGLSAMGDPRCLAATTQPGHDRSLASTSRLSKSIPSYSQPVGTAYQDVTSNSSYSDGTPGPYQLLAYDAHHRPNSTSDSYPSADAYPYQRDPFRPQHPLEHSFDNSHTQSTLNDNHHGPDWSASQQSQQEPPLHRPHKQQRQQQWPGAMHSQFSSTPRTTVGSAPFEAPIHTVVSDLGPYAPYQSEWQYHDYPALAGSVSRSSSTSRDSNHSSQYPSYSASGQWASAANLAQLQPQHQPHLQHTGHYYLPHEYDAPSAAPTDHDYHSSSLSALDQSYRTQTNGQLRPNGTSHPVPLEGAYDSSRNSSAPLRAPAQRGPIPLRYASPVSLPPGGPGSTDTSDPSWHGPPTGTLNPALHSSSHAFTFAHNALPTSTAGTHSSKSGSYDSRLISTPPMTPGSAPGSSGSATTSEAASSPSAVVLVAAAERRKIREELAAAEEASKNLAASPGNLVPSLIPGVKAVAVKKSTQPGSARPCLELPVSCQMCAEPIGKLSLRGTSIDKAKDQVVPKGVYYCLGCVPVSTRGKPSSANREPEATYADTLSAAVDRLESLTLGRSPNHGASPTGSAQHRSAPHPAPTSASKKRAKGEENLLTCDICRRDIGSGELTCVLRGAPPGTEVEYTPEVACASCSDKYRRCSDCGGGGGTKGVGRWRARELFPGGRRTCQLSHARQGSLSEMSYDVWPITSLPPDQLPDLVAMCRELYMLHVLGTLAVPDMMESVAPLASTFEQVLLLATDSWPMFEQAIRENIEPTTSTRRYLALRWMTARKPRSKGEGSRGANTPSLTANGRTLAGFVLAEQDLLLGSCYITVTVPTGTGEGYDATSRLMHSLFRHIQNDIASINTVRGRQNEPLLPLLKHAWTLHFEKRESRVMNRPDAKRGFVTLEEYLATYPDADEKHFSPYRPVWLSNDLLKYWTCYVKRITDNDDWLVTNTRRITSTSAGSSAGGNANGGGGAAPPRS